MRRLNDDIDRRSIKRTADGVGHLSAIEARAAGYRKVGRNAVGEPDRSAGGRQHSGRPASKASVSAGSVGALIKVATKGRWSAAGLLGTAGACIRCHRMISRLALRCLAVG